MTRAVQRVVVENLTTLADAANMSQVRAIATLELEQRMLALSKAGTGSMLAHDRLLAADIKRFLERPSSPATRESLPGAPPGAPIGEPAMDWLQRSIEPPCSLWDGH
ncbi:MAG TPA: hypothetical protein VLD67_13750 [Vicinamibacterales bacterium]|nr:hypothetical protein [Vicinamibacterales bacterium]